MQLELGPARARDFATVSGRGWPGLRVEPGDLKPWGFQVAINKVIPVAAARAIFVGGDKKGKRPKYYPSTTMYDMPSII
jgi:hypothetical protein